MKKVNKKRKPKKELSTAANVILVLMFVPVFVYFGISIGFLINSFINYSIDYIITNTLLTLVVGIVYMILLLILIRNRESENVKTFKWYINCILISFTITLIITAVTVFTLGTQEDNVINYLIGVGVFPLIGIIATPNIVKHVKNDTTKWEDIFYKNGNLHNIKGSKDYYSVSTPVSFEKKILSAVYKGQLKNILIVIVLMGLIIATSIHYFISEHSYTGDIIRDYIEVKARRASVGGFLLMIFFITFGIMIIAYYVSNAVKKIKTVKNHEYIAYHAIVPGVHNGNIGIYHKNVHYTYKYCTCVGIKEKDVNSTPATLIFVPDEVFLFPDSEEDEDFKHNNKRLP